MRTTPARDAQQEACISHLNGMAPQAALAVACGAILMALWLRADVAATWLLPWVGLMLLLSALRATLPRLVRKYRSRLRDTAWEQAYALLAGITGLAWGMLAWMPFPELGEQQVLLITAMLFCILLVGCSTLVASRLAFYSFAALLAGPLFARLFSLNSERTLFIAACTLVLSWLVVSAFRNQHRLLSETLASDGRSAALLQQHRVLLESAGEGIVLLRPAPEFVVECNRRFAELFGYALHDMAGMEPWRWHPDRSQWKRLVIASSPVIAAGQPYRDVIPLRRHDGAQFWGEVTGMAVDPTDLRKGTVWVVSDLSPQRAAEAALRISEQRFRELVRLSSDLYWAQDSQFRFTHVDGSTEILRLIEPERLLGKSRWEIRGIIGVSAATWKAHISTLARHEPFRDFVYQMKGSDGMRRHYAVSGTPLFDAEGRFCGYHGIASDISGRIESEERFRHLAYHDSLTGLPNRRLLADRLNQAIRTATRNGHQAALLLIDLDGFKQVNDILGHAAGDRVLEAVAQRLQDAVREADTVARLGGDEFVVLLPRIGDIEDVLRVAEKIHLTLSEPINVGGHPQRIGSSIGASLFPQHGDNADLLLARADAAMYDGKRTGGRRTSLYNTYPPQHPSYFWPPSG